MFGKRAFITHPVFVAFMAFVLGLIVMGVLTYLGYTSGMVCVAGKP